MYCHGLLFWLQVGGGSCRSAAATLVRLARMVGANSTFLKYLQKHSLVRLTKSAYWVCAYANNQHNVEEDISKNPRKSSFYKAMQLCQGVLLVLDSQATPFRRIWCCFEESIAVRLPSVGRWCSETAFRGFQSLHVAVLAVLGIRETS